MARVNLIWRYFRTTSISTKSSYSRSEIGYGLHSRRLIFEAPMQKQFVLVGLHLAPLLPRPVAVGLGMRSKVGVVFRRHARIDPSSGLLRVIFASQAITKFLKQVASSKAI